MSQNCSTAILLISCPDQMGLVSRISQFIFERSGNILDLDQHVDPNEGIFSARIAWDMRNFRLSPSELKEALFPIAIRYKT